eukprot:TRINITY_DN7309_c0_g1_i1.p1 TRINITY_DN7309_c0_g1~~TRINITY_DN7309_c0_g1_i1.p1  ORF type:complete len:228 (-),score=46.54 TRINITY_DN7309_c0_g1_i1:225-845(-)
MLDLSLSELIVPVTVTTLVAIVMFWVMSKFIDSVTNIIVAPPSSPAPTPVDANLAALRKKYRQYVKEEDGGNNGLKSPTSSMDVNLRSLVKRISVQVPFFTREHLRLYDGLRSPSIYLSCWGKIFDVSSAKMLYGMGAPYHLFAGREISTCLLKRSMEATDIDQLVSEANLEPEEKAVAKKWMDLYSKYPMVGLLRERALSDSKFV